MIAFLTTPFKKLIGRIRNKEKIAGLRRRLLLKATDLVVEQKRRAALEIRLAILTQDHNEAIHAFAEWRHQAFAKNVLRVVPTEATVHRNDEVQETVKRMVVPRLEVHHTTPDFELVMRNPEQEYEFELRLRTQQIHMLATDLAEKIVDNLSGTSN